MVNKKKMKLEVLCATIGQKDFSLIEKMNIRSDVLYANQSNYFAFEEKKFQNVNSRMITTNSKGVGINRNICLLLCKGDIGLFADDDVRYDDDYEKTIIEAFLKFKDADIIVFNIKLAAGDIKRTPRIIKKEKKLQIWNKYGYGSCRIAIRINSIRMHNIYFSTMFGGGAIFPSGEDSLFMQSARKEKLNIFLSNRYIGEVNQSTSTWMTGFDKKYFYGKGAYQRAAHRRSYLIWFLYILLRERRSTNMGILECFRWMQNGANGYKKILSYDQYEESL